MGSSNIHNFTKGSVLLHLKNKTKYFKIPKTYLFTVGNWLNEKENILNIISKKFSNAKFLAVRSSAITEDKKKFSLAGKYHTELFVNSRSKKKNNIIN